MQVKSSTSRLRGSQLRRTGAAPAARRARARKILIDKLAVVAKLIALIAFLYLMNSIENMQK